MTQSVRFEFTRHARDRQAQRGIPTCLVRLAIDRGTRLLGADRERFVLTAAELDAAGFGPSAHALEVVTCDRRILTVQWLDRAWEAA